MRSSERLALTSIYGKQLRRDAISIASRSRRSATDLRWLHYDRCSKTDRAKQFFIFVDWHRLFPHTETEVRTDRRDGMFGFTRLGIARLIAKPSVPTYGINEFSDVWHPIANRLVMLALKTHQHICLSVFISVLFTYLFHRVSIVAH